MRVNSRVFTERVDMLNELSVKDCPSAFAKEANRLLNMTTEVGYSPPKNERTITELYKMLTIDYWRKFDGLTSDCDLRTWYITATDPSLIERAVRILVEKQYFILDEDVMERRDKAAHNIRESMRRK